MEGTIEVRGSQKERKEECIQNTGSQKKNCARRLEDLESRVLHRPYLRELVGADDYPVSSLAIRQTRRRSASRACKRREA